MNFGGGSSSGNAQQQMFAQAEKSREAEQQRQNSIRDATTNINQKFGNQFNDDFFTGRQKAAESYYAPQLQDQFADAQKALTYWLGDRGLLDSSVANDKRAELQKQYDTNSRTVNNNVLDMVNNERNRVSTAKSGLINDVTSSGDAAASANATAAQIAALSSPEVYSPLANMFADFTSGLKSQAALEQAAAASGGAVKPLFNTGLFAPAANSVTAY